MKRLFVGCILLTPPALLSANPVLTVMGLAAVPVLFALLWREGEPPVLLFAAAFQWLQVFMPVITADRDGQIISDWSMRTAVWLGLVAIVVLAAGMRMGVGRRPIADAEDLNRTTNQLDARRLAWAYALAFLIGELAIAGGGIVPGLRQQLLALVVMRWAVIFLIGWAALRHTQYRPLAFFVFLLELVLGFTGYFGGFKTILFLAIILIIGSRGRLRKSLRPALVVTFLATVLLGSFWQVAKEDYRFYVSEGERAQVVRVPVLSRLEFLIDTVGKTGWQDLEYGFDSALDRLGYLEFFARTIQTVPARIPHQHGRLWLEALTHIVTPRVLFPGKPAINDSDRTTEFTGARVAGVEEGTSISIGYAGESYIDFGPVVMFVPIVFLGCFWGWCYRWLATRTPRRLLGIAVSTNLILAGAIYFEASNIKLLGGAITSTIVFWFLLKYGGDLIWRFVAPHRTVGAIASEPDFPPPVIDPAATATTIWFR